MPLNPAGASLPYASSMNVLVRKALASDIEVLTELSRRTISSSYRPILGDEAVDAFLGSGAADRYVADHVAESWVIQQDGQVLGYAACRDNLIDLMMIDHEVHRRGLGAALLAHVEKEMFQEHTELRLESFAANEPANAFYRKQGWLDVSRRFDEASGVAKIVFRKALS
jgi:ribosomal protein S18 acetylase RimI-like enzyme